MHADVYGVIGGSGTVGRIPKLTDSTTIGDSVIYESAGNIGIGTANPLKALHILAWDHAQLRLESSGGRNASLHLYPSASGSHSWSVHGANNGFHIFDLSGNEDRVVISNAGNVGIGTTNPSGKLDVNGSIYQRGSQLHADYVFEPGYELESIDEHSQFMWQRGHLKAIPKARKDAEGRDIVEVGAHRKGIVEELEKAHIYIEQLHKRMKVMEEELAKLKAEVRAEE